MKLFTGGLCIALAVLELVHPRSTFEASPAWWQALHAALLVGYALLCVLLWRMFAGPLARATIVLFALANTTFLSLEGVFATPQNTLLADVTGAAWCLMLLTLSGVHGLVLTLVWLAFVASAFGISPLLPRAVAIAAVGWLAYRSGASAIPAALLVFAAVLRQHVGPEAALGVVCVALSVTAGSGPGAASRPSTG